MPDDATVRLDICRFSLAPEQLPQRNGAVVGDSNEEQEGRDHPPDLFGVLLVVPVHESPIRCGSNHFKSWKGRSLVGYRAHTAVYIRLSMLREKIKNLDNGVSRSSVRHISYGVRCCVGIVT